MSGGPPHHPHNRQIPPANTAWNHLQVPNFYPRPQLAHMSTEHSLLHQHQPTWHTPTTTEAAIKMHPHAHMLTEMLKNPEQLFPRDCVDLSLARNGNQNGELPSAPTPISLSVRDTNKINSLPPSALEIQAVGLTGLKSLSPGLKSGSPGLKSASPGFVPKSVSPGMGPTSPVLKPTSPQSVPVVQSTPEVKAHQKRANVRVDSILERLNPTPEKVVNVLQESRSDEPQHPAERPATVVERVDKPQPIDKPVSVIIQPTSSFDDNSNSSSTLNTPKDEDTVSTYSNEDSLDSNKSRRKRKPSKTVRVSKEEGKNTPSPEECEHSEGNKDKESSEDKESVKVEEKKEQVSEKDPVSIVGEMLEAKEEKGPEKGSADELDELLVATSRRKTSSESETIDNIAAMVQEGLKEKQVGGSAAASSEPPAPEQPRKEPDEVPEKQEIASQPAKPISVSVIKTKENLAEVLTDALAAPSTARIVTPAQKKATNTHFVEVENKLEEMFAGIEDTSEPLTRTVEPLELNDSKLEDSLLKLEEPDVEKEPQKQEDVKEPSKQDNEVSTMPQEPTIAAESKEPVESPTELAEAVEPPPTSQEQVTVTSSTEIQKKKPATSKTKRKSRSVSRRDSDVSPMEPKLKKKKLSTPVPKLGKTKGDVKKSPASPLKKQSVSASNNNKSSSEIPKDPYAYDSGSNASSGKSRGPFIHIKGSRDSPISVSVVNAPLGDEDGERKPTKTKKYHDDSEYRHKVRSKGLHCSTLSNKYDAQTKDATWICAFCKRGPHASELSGPTHSTEGPPMGDLFGPYFITSRCPEFERRLDDPFDRQFKSRKVGAATLAATTVPPTSKKANKRKISEGEGESDVYLGIHESQNGADAEPSYEVWAHEDCIAWSPGTYLVAARVVGLEEAVWQACGVPCTVCRLRGATVCCLRRGCQKSTHVPCARHDGWRLDEEAGFRAWCDEHAT